MINSVRKTFLIVAFICSLCSLKAQIQGVSARKIISINHQGLSQGSAEFEPAIQFNYTKTKWDQKGDQQSLYATEDSILIEQDVSLRMAYAFSDKFEIGAVISDDNSSWSFRQRLYNGEKLGFAFLGGLNIPYGNQVIDKNFRSRDNTMNYVLGLAGSYQFFKVSSLDINFQLQNYLRSGDLLPSSEYFIFSDYGHYIHTSKIQLLVACSYQQRNFENFSENKWTYYQGVYIETNPNYKVVALVNYDLWGKNTHKSLGFNVAWTLVF